MKTLKSCSFLLLFLLAISFSSSTAMACGTPVSVDRTTVCYGGGWYMDFPAGVGYSNDDGDCTSSFYGTPCGQCQYGLHADLWSDYVCVYDQVGYACDSQTAATWWYLYTYQNYSAFSLYLYFNCYPTDYQGKLLIPPFKMGKHAPIEAVDRSRALPYRV
jgi:hypothetical protein